MPRLKAFILATRLASITTCGGGGADDGGASGDDGDAMRQRSR